MIPNLEYTKPETIDELLELLKGNDGNSKLLAGGTDIIPGFQQDANRFRNIQKLIDINDIQVLQEIKQNENHLEIGAATTFTDIIESDLVKKHFPLLRKAVSTIGSRQIRNRATLGGNFINNAPCADSVPPMLVYDALVEVRSSSTVHEYLLKDFLLKPYSTRLKNDEIVTKVRLPIQPSKLRGDFVKLGRRRGVSISRITLAVLLSVENTTISDIKIASGAVTPIGKRFYELEEFAKNTKIDNEKLKVIAKKLGEVILDTTGLRWSSDYKVPVVQQMCYNLLERLVHNED